MKGKRGEIYLARNRNTGRIKIGFTTRPIIDRINELLTGNDCDIDVVDHWVATYEDERVLQTLYGEYHVRGEWFDLPQEVIQELRATRPRYYSKGPAPQLEFRYGKEIRGISESEIEMVIDLLLSYGEQSLGGGEDYCKAIGGVLALRREWALAAARGGNPLTRLRNRLSLERLTYEEALSLIQITNHRAALSVILEQEVKAQGRNAERRPKVRDDASRTTYGVPYDDDIGLLATCISSGWASDIAPRLIELARKRTANVH